MSSSSARSVLSRQSQRDLIDVAISKLDTEEPTFLLAISGNGFFLVRDPRGNKTYATQVRSFRVDSVGHLLGPTGARLQGRTGPGLKDIGDIQVTAAGLPAGKIPGSSMLCYSIDDWGKITVHLADGDSFVCGQIILQNFSEPQALVNEGNQLFSNLANAGPLNAPSIPGSNGLGTIQSGVLELSVASATNWLN
jgi:flagellar hook protein FlgE